MANSTNKGITYPTSGDSIAPLETHFANLATTADNTGVISGSATFTGPSAAASPATVSVTFPLTFATAPKVVLTVADSATATPYIATVYSTPTTTGFVAKIHCLSSVTAETLKLTWFASTYTA